MPQNASFGFAGMSDEKFLAALHAMQPGAAQEKKAGEANHG